MTRRTPFGGGACGAQPYVSPVSLKFWTHTALGPKETVEVNSASRASRGESSESHLFGLVV